MNSLWRCHLYPASRTPVVQSQRLDVSCQHVKLIVRRLNSVCGCVAVPTRVATSPSLTHRRHHWSPNCRWIHQFQTSHTLPTSVLTRFRRRPVHWVRAATRPTWLTYWFKTMSDTNSPGNSDLFWQLKNGGSVMKWMAELRVRGKSQPMTTRTRRTWHLRCSLVCKTRRQVALIGRIFSYFCPECMAA